jgi:hypothetical protein
MLAAVGVCARLGYESPVVWPRHYNAHPCPMVSAARHAVGNRGLFDPSAGTCRTFHPQKVNVNPW